MYCEIVSTVIGSGRNIFITLEDGNCIHMWRCVNSQYGIQRIIDRCTGKIYDTREQAEKAFLELKIYAMENRYCGFEDLAKSANMENIYVAS